MTRVNNHVTGTVVVRNTWSTNIQLDDVLASSLANLKKVGQFPADNVCKFHISPLEILHTLRCSCLQEYPANIVLREKDLGIATNHIGLLQ